MGTLIVAGAEVFLHLVVMRHAKIAVLDALHDGDAERAVAKWAAVEEACRRMVAACRDAPNTQMLAERWRRL